MVKYNHFQFYIDFIIAKREPRLKEAIYKHWETGEILFTYFKNTPELRELYLKLQSQYDLSTEESVKKIIDDNLTEAEIQGLQLIINKKKEAKNLYDIYNYQENVKEFYNFNPFFYDRSQIFWIWDKNLFCYRITDETDLFLAFDKFFNIIDRTIKGTIKSNYLEAFKRVGRDNIPKEAKVDWIQFKDKAFSLHSGNIYEVKSNFFFTNPIPWEMGVSDDTPIMDKLFTQWLGDKKEQLYELMTYCCYRGYPLQLMFCLFGCGRNGKSQFLKILNKFLGDSNCVSSELEILTKNDFATFQLYKKLICVMGETNFGLLKNTSKIKQLVGGDKIRYEKKGKDSFSDYSYCKLIIASNSLPTSEDTSDGFFRRWCIIKFMREFEEGREVWLDVPDQEYSNLARKVCNILPRLLKEGKFSGQGTIEERKNIYISVSNPLPQFIALHCQKDIYSYISFNELYNEYIKYLMENKTRRVSRKEFLRALEDEGLAPNRTYHKVQTKDENGSIWDTSIRDYWVEGIKLSQISQLSNTFKVDSYIYKETVINIMDNRDNLDKMIDINNFDHCKQIILSYEAMGEDCKLEDLSIFPKTNIDKWLQDGLIYEPRSGIIKLVRT